MSAGYGLKVVTGGNPVIRWKAVWQFPVTRIAVFGAMMLLFYAGLSIAIEPLDRLGYRTWAEPAAAVAALWVMARLDGIGLAGFGLKKPSAIFRDTAVGFLVGGLTMTLVVGMMAAFGWYHGKVEPLRPLVIGSLENSIQVFLAIAITEELIFRGYFFQTLERRWGSDIAFAVTMVTFGLIHLTADIPGASTSLRVIGALSIAVEAGILFAAAYLLTRRLWMPIGVHWAWNFFQGPVFGAPVTGSDTGPSVFSCHITGPEWATGGQFGPEASIPALLVGTCFGVIVLWIAMHRKAAHGKHPEETVVL